MLDVTTTLKAKAFHPDYAPSETLTQVYTVRTRTPTLSRAGGSYAPGARVIISNVDPAATIRITLTGVDPTATDPTVPSGTSLLVGGFALKARAFKAGNADSAVATAVYVLTEPFGPGAVAAGGSHTVLSTPQGLLYGWGLGSSGQIGDGTTMMRTMPTLVQTLTGVTALSAGSSHTLALTYDGRVFAWGVEQLGTAWRWNDTESVGAGSGLHAGQCSGRSGGREPQPGADE